jgi:polar amino acid transport system permease protein
MSEITEVGDIAFSHPLPRRQRACRRSSGSNRYAGLRIIPARYPARIAGSVLAVLLLAAIASSVATNPRWGWAVFAEWFWPPRCWKAWAAPCC